MFNHLEKFNNALKNGGKVADITPEKSFSKINPNPKEIGKEVSKYEKTAPKYSIKSKTPKSIVESLITKNLRLIESQEYAWGKETKLDEKARDSSNEYNIKPLDKSTRIKFNQNKYSKPVSPLKQTKSFN